MKRYEIEIDEEVSNFFEEIAISVERPVEEILSDTLFKYVEIISRKLLNFADDNDEILS